MSTTLIKTCPKPDCVAESDPKSTKGYCPTHKSEARAAFKQHIEDQKIERQLRIAGFKALHDRAHEAGFAAGQAATPQMMIVIDRRAGKEYHDHEGICGFAQVTIQPGSCSFARWLVKEGHARKAYGGGVAIWVSLFGQSMERKEAYARAYAQMVLESEVLPAKGGRVFAESRAD